jgi:Ala-tRNA(Pro) deacylase
MVVKKLIDFLDSNDVKYTKINHPPEYTAQEIAASSHITGKEIAKTVMVKVDGKIMMAVLPATNQIDFGRLKQAIGAEKVELASEEEFEGRFPDCETGAMPPFGNLYGMDVLVEDNLTNDEEIAFNAGSHSELIKMSYKDFERLVKPGKAGFSS